MMGLPISKCQGVIFLRIGLGRQRDKLDQLRSGVLRV